LTENEQKELEAAVTPIWMGSSGALNKQFLELHPKSKYNGKELLAISRGWRPPPPPF
jgi:hypothetical protein